MKSTDSPHCPAKPGPWVHREIERNENHGSAKASEVKTTTNERSETRDPPAKTSLLETEMKLLNRRKLSTNRQRPRRVCRILPTSKLRLERTENREALPMATRSATEMSGPYPSNETMEPTLWIFRIYRFWSHQHSGCFQGVLRRLLDTVVT